MGRSGNWVYVWRTNRVSVHGHHLKETEDIDFKYTTMSLNDVYAMGMKHALQVVERNGGKINGDQVTIAVQTPKSVRIEQAFAGHHPVLAKGINKDLENEYSFDFGELVLSLKGKPNPKTAVRWVTKVYLPSTPNCMSTERKLKRQNYPSISRTVDMTYSGNTNYQRASIRYVLNC